MLHCNIEIFKVYFFALIDKHSICFVFLEIAIKKHSLCIRNSNKTKKNSRIWYREITCKDIMLIQILIIFRLKESRFRSIQERMIGFELGNIFLHVSVWQFKDQYTQHTKSRFEIISKLVLKKGDKKWGTVF